LRLRIMAETGQPRMHALRS